MAGLGGTDRALLRFGVCRFGSSVERENTEGPDVPNNHEIPRVLNLFTGGEFGFEGGLVVSASTILRTGALAPKDPAAGVIRYDHQGAQLHGSDSFSGVPVAAKPEMGAEFFV